MHFSANLCIRAGTILSILTGAALTGCGSSSSNSDGAGGGAADGNAGASNFNVAGGANGGGAANSGGGGASQGGAAGAAGGVLTGDAACVSDVREGEQLPVDLYFMVDITGSMHCPVGPAGDTCMVDPGAPYAADTRWSEESVALKTFFSSTTTSGLGAGISFFPVAMGDVCDPANYTTPMVEIAPLPGAATALNAAVDAQNPAGNTPTVASITGATQHASDWAKAHPDRNVAVVYSTDGYPVGCNGNTIAAAAQVAQAALMATPSVPTYVLGMGNNLASLNQIAAAGGTTQAYLIDTGKDIASQLADALKNIQSRAITCDYKIPAPPAGQTLNPQLVNVQARVGGAAMSTLVDQVAGAASCDATTGGWYYDNPTTPTTIKLCTQSCDPLLNTAGSQLDVLFGCTTVTHVK